jgi:hypothetical protein
MCCVQGVGYGIAIAAFFWYNHIKMQQLGQQEKASAKGGEAEGKEVEAAPLIPTATNSSSGTLDSKA